MPCTLPKLCIVVPCYNEEQVLALTAPLFLDELEDLKAKGKVSPASTVLFVNDGSRDGTWDIIRNLAETDARCEGLCLSRNFGHQKAVLAGLMEAKDRADITISIDCDGQDDVTAMEAMVDAYHDGCEVVYGVRSDRSSDTWFKRSTAQGFYRFLRSMGVETVYNHADYRLVSAKVLAHFADYEEVNIFLRGMFPLVGFPSTSVYYARHERLAGKSHYPLGKMLGLALDGVTSLSTRPIRIISGMGIAISILGLVGVIWAICSALSGHTVDGWASLVCIVCFLGGIQLLSLGVIGEYVGKGYLETKRRPRYIVAERTFAQAADGERGEGREGREGRERDECVAAAEAAEEAEGTEAAEEA